MNLIRIGIEDARKLWQMQTEAFQDLYKKYQDTENSPAAENIDKTIMRLQQPCGIIFWISTAMIILHSSYMTCSRKALF